MKKALALVVAAILSTGCATMSREEQEVDIPTSVDVPVVPDSGSVVGGNEESVIDVDLGVEANYLLLSEVNKSDPIPRIEVKGFSASGASLRDVLTALLGSKGLYFTLSADLSEDDSVAKIEMINAQGSLEDILNRISASLGIYYTYSEKGFHFSKTKQFLFSLPPLENDAIEKIVTMIGKLGGEEVSADEFSSTVIFRAKPSTYEAIHAYLDHMRKNKVLIVYDIYLWEVRLNDGFQGGINWNDFSYTDGAFTGSLTGGGSSALTSGLSLGAVYNSSKFTVDALASFLKTQGNLKSISQPKVSLVAGTESEFEIGSTSRYVSKIGTTVVSTGSSVTQTTVETEDVLSGVNLAIKGVMDGGAVHTDLKLKISDLVRFNEFKTLDTTLQLPQTSKRTLKTTVKAKPGDYIVLAGINISKDQDDLEGLPGVKGGVSVPSSMNREVERSELVMIMRPRVVKFSGGEK